MRQIYLFWRLYCIGHWVNAARCVFLVVIVIRNQCEILSGFPQLRTKVPLTYGMYLLSQRKGDTSRSNHQHCRNRNRLKSLQTDNLVLRITTQVCRVAKPIFLKYCVKDGFPGSGYGLYSFWSCETEASPLFLSRWIQTIKKSFLSTVVEFDFAWNGDSEAMQLDKGAPCVYIHRRLVPPCALMYWVISSNVTKTAYCYVRELCVSSQIYDH